MTTQEALAELAAAKLKLETMQQLLVLKEQLLYPQKMTGKDNAGTCEDRKSLEYG